MDERLVIEVISVYLCMYEGSDQIVVLPGTPALGDHSSDVLDVAPEHAHRQFPSGRVVGSLGLQQVVRPTQEVVTSGRLEAKEISDSDQGQLSRDLRDEIALSGLADTVEDLVTHPADPSLALSYAAGGEPAAHQATPPLVLGGVHVDHHGHRRCVGPDSTRAGEGLGILRYLFQVGVARNPPHTVRLVQVHGGVFAHPGKSWIRIASIEVSVDQVDGDVRRIRRVDVGRHVYRPLGVWTRSCLDGKRCSVTLRSYRIRMSPQSCRQVALKLSPFELSAETVAYVVLPDFSVTAAFNQFESVNDPELLLSSLITECVNFIVL